MAANAAGRPERDVKYCGGFRPDASRPPRVVSTLTRRCSATATSAGSAAGSRVRAIRRDNYVRNRLTVDDGSIDANIRAKDVIGVVPQEEQN